MEFKPNGLVGKAVKDREPVVEQTMFVPKPIKSSKEIDTTFDVGLIAAWSFSSLQSFEQCPRKVAYKQVDKIPEPSSAAAERGSEIHNLAERYVKGETADDEVPLPLQKFKMGFEALRRAYQDGKVTCEEEWAFTKDWSVTDWRANDCWHRAKLDVFLVEGDGSALIIDYKTGKKFGNELKHGEQGLTYAIGAFLRYPELDFIKIEFWYLDKGEKLIRQYTRQQALVFHPSLHQRAKAMTTAVDFPVHPSLNACRFCYYGAEGICKEKFDASQIQ